MKMVSPAPSFLHLFPAVNSGVKIRREPILFRYTNA